MNASTAVGAGKPPLAVPSRSPHVQEELERFPEVWLVVFDHDRPAGESPVPTRLLAREVRTGRTVDLGCDALIGPDASPIPTGGEALLVAYDGSATLGCFRSLGWEPPHNVL